MDRTVYYDKQTGKYFNQDEYNKIVNQRVEKMRKNKITFSNWLDDNYTASEIFHFTLLDKLSVMDNYDSYCMEAVKECMDELQLNSSKRNDVNSPKITCKVWNKNVPMTLEDVMEYLETDTKAVGATCFVRDLEHSIWYHCVLDYHCDLGLVALYGANDEEEMFKEKDYGTKWVAYEYMPV